MRHDRNEFAERAARTHRTMVKSGATTAPYCALRALCGRLPPVVGETGKEGAGRRQSQNALWTTGSRSPYSRHSIHKPQWTRISPKYGG